MNLRPKSALVLPRLVPSLHGLLFCLPRPPILSPFCISPLLQNTRLPTTSVHSLFHAYDVQKLGSRCSRPCGNRPATGISDPSAVLCFLLTEVVSLRHRGQVPLGPPDGAVMAFVEICKGASFLLMWVVSVFTHIHDFLVYTFCVSFCKHQQLRGFFPPFLYTVLHVSLCSFW